MTTTITHNTRKIGEMKMSRLHNVNINETHFNFNLMLSKQYDTIIRYLQKQRFDLSANKP